MVSSDRLTSLITAYIPRLFASLFVLAPGPPKACLTCFPPHRASQFWVTPQATFGAPFLLPRTSILRVLAVQPKQWAETTGNQLRFFLVNLQLDPRATPRDPLDSLLPRKPKGGPLGMRK